MLWLPPLYFTSLPVAEAFKIPELISMVAPLKSKLALTPLIKVEPALVPVRLVLAVNEVWLSSILSAAMVTVPLKNIFPAPVSVTLASTAKAPPEVKVVLLLRLKSLAKVTAPPPVLLKVPLLMILSLKVKADVLAVENEPPAATVKGPLKLADPVLLLSVILPLIRVAPLTTSTPTFRFSAPGDALMVNEANGFAGLIFSTIAWLMITTSPGSSPGLMPGPGPTLVQFETVFQLPAAAEVYVFCALTRRPVINRQITSIILSR